MKEIKTLKIDAVVVGSGAAGFAAALSLVELGVREVAIISECTTAGTSRNTGSDKQTYYKTSLYGDIPDSPYDMARDLFSYGAVDGDSALCEAVGSARAFMRLCSLGVDFPTDAFGSYIGYKTDHDPRSRATSAGPLTSRYMTEALEAEYSRRGGRVISGLRVIEILKSNGRAVGLLAIDRDARLYAIDSPNIIFATGGASSIYADSVYPESQLGALGTLVRSGITLQNLTEWQYGMASLCPRWNVSGTYMQSLPSFVSVDPDGGEHFFLEEFYKKSRGEGLSSVFLKGYQWPFDSRKLSGSSVIDLLVYRERVAGRRVYLDYMREPFYGFELSELSPEAREYLVAAGAMQTLPIDRLIHMNKPAYELYLSKGVDLKRERLEISLCAQHHNGGASVDSFWQSSLDGLFVVGEAAGTHGVYRPGGSALNAGQVGAYRAAKYVAQYPSEHDADGFDAALGKALEAHKRLYGCIGKDSSLDAASFACKRKMSDIAAAVRDADKISAEIAKTRTLIEEITDRVSIKDEREIYELCLFVDMLYARLAVLSAIADFAGVSDGGSRGSALYINERGSAPAVGLEALSYTLSPDLSEKVQEAVFDEGTREMRIRWRERRPLPSPDGFFENVWREYRESRGVTKRS